MAFRWHDPGGVRGLGLRWPDAFPVKARQEVEQDDCPYDAPLVASYVDNVMVYPPRHEMGVPKGRFWGVRELDGNGIFYAYYQISGVGEPDEAETEPQKEGELKSRWEGSHSPFGFIWQIASATGWSVEYILHGVNYQTLIMMIADAPRYVDKKQKETDNMSAEEEAADIVGFFQSQLK